MTMPYVHELNERATGVPIWRHLKYAHGVKTSREVSEEEYESQHVTLHDEAVEMGKRRKGKGKKKAPSNGSAWWSTSYSPKIYHRRPFAGALEDIVEFTRRKTPAEIRAEIGVRRVKVVYRAVIEIPADLEEYYASLLEAEEPFSLEEVLDDTLEAYVVDEEFDRPHKVEVLRSEWLFEEVEPALVEAE